MRQGHRAGEGILMNLSVSGADDGENSLIEMDFEYFNIKRIPGTFVSICIVVTEEWGSWILMCNQAPSTTFINDKRGNGAGQMEGECANVPFSVRQILIVFKIHNKKKKKELLLIPCMMRA